MTRPKLPPAILALLVKFSLTRSKISPAVGAKVAVIRSVAIPTIFCFKDLPASSQLVILTASGKPVF